MLKAYISMQTYMSGLLNRDDRGATMVEYGLLVAFIAVVVGAAAVTLGGAVATLFGNVVASL